MGKNPGYLPAAAWSVGAMLDEQMHITWHCETCRHYGPVNLLEVARVKGVDYCMVDKKTHCRTAGCGGIAYFRYAAGPGTPSRRLEALREAPGRCPVRGGRAGDGAGQGRLQRCRPPPAAADATLAWRAAERRMGRRANRHRSLMTELEFGETLHL